MADVLLAVSGGIAAYKSLDVLRILQRRGHDVTVIMTRNAERFVGAASFSALSGRPVGVRLFGPASQPGYDHLDLARRADVMLICPATANTLARMSAGLATDLVGSVYLAMDKPVLAAPAMNTKMWEHPATRANLVTLSGRGVVIVPPATGLLADGEVGEGRLADPTTIVDALERIIAERPLDLAGRRILVTGGGTREPIDAVRYIGNRSSGKMAVALCEAARDRGAEVALIGSNLTVDVPTGVAVTSAPTAHELAVACRDGFGRCDLLIMAAAVADYRPVVATDGKLDKSQQGSIDLRLERTDDILAGLADARHRQVIVGFAAEYGADAIDRARDKRARKGLDVIVFNDISAPGIGFESDENAVTVIGPGATETVVAKMNKRAVAERILDAAAVALDENRLSSGP